MNFLEACMAWEADYIRQNQEALEAQGNYVHVDEDVPGLDDLGIISIKED